MPCFPRAHTLGPSSRLPPLAPLNRHASHHHLYHLSPPTTDHTPAPFHPHASHYQGKPVGTPDAGTFWRTIRRHGVKAMFTAPTALRAIRKEDPRGRFLTEVRPPAHTAAGRWCRS